jgi:arsenite methyltransferase
VSAPVLVAQPELLKACCAELWGHPGVRVLVGEALHPGGADLTERALDSLAAPPGARILDVGSGPGASRDLAVARGLRVVGIDRFSTWQGGSAAGHFLAGDAEELPFADESFQGALAECVLSVVPNKQRAADELFRVLTPGSRVAMSDVVVEGSLPEEFRTLLGWIACAAGALSAGGYRSVLARAGFRVEEREDHREALREFVARALRRLSLFQGALGAGVIDAQGSGVQPGLLDLGRDILLRAAQAVGEGIIGYDLIVAAR